MLAFHGDPAIKVMYLARVRAHRAADEIVQGQYWEYGKGCAVGCTIHGSDHSRYETELGIPEVLARLQDWVFECLSLREALTFPEAFLSAIPVGADLATVADQFVHWILTDPEHGVHRFTDSDGASIIRRVADLYARRLARDEPTEDEWGLLHAEFENWECWDSATWAAYSAMSPDTVGEVPFDACGAAGEASGGTASEAMTSVLATKLISLLSTAPVSCELVPVGTSP